MSMRSISFHPAELAAEACEIEIDRLGDPIGKQDQYIAAFGGITCFRFLKNDRVEAWPLALSQETLYNLEDSLLMFFTGYSRAAATILKDQDVKTRLGDRDMVANFDYVKSSGCAAARRSKGGGCPSLARSCTNTGSTSGSGQEAFRARASTNGTISRSATARLAASLSVQAAAASCCSMRRTSSACGTS